MKLVRFNGGRTGVVTDAGVLDATAQVGETWIALIERRVIIDPSEAEPVADDVVLEPPLPSPAARIFAMGVNFADHVAAAANATATKVPGPPAGFVIPGSVVGHEAVITPPADAQKLDYEAEVAAILDGRGGVWGYTGFNDVSIRDPHLGLSRLDEGALSWALQKNFYGGNVLGPYVVVDPEVGELPIRSWVNGELRQDGTTADMVRSFTDGAQYLQRYLPLGAGDMLTSGTPAGTAIEQGIDGPFLNDGDVIEIEVGRAGTLRNRIRTSGS